MNADSSDLNVLPSATSHGAHDARVDLQESLSGAVEIEFIHNEKSDNNAYKLALGEKTSIKISSDLSTNKCFNHNGSEAERGGVVKVESEDVYTTHDVIVEDKRDEKMRIETGSIFEKSCVTESVPEVEEIAVEVKVPEGKGEKPLSVKERMKFYREKEVESGVSARYDRGFATSRSQAITAHRAEIEVTKDILFEDKRKHSEEISSGFARKEDVKSHTDSLSEVLDTKRKERGEVLEFSEETEEVLLDKSAKKEDKPMEIYPIRGNLKHSLEAFTCEYNEKEIERKSDPGLRDEEKEDQRLGEEVVADVSRDVPINHMLIDNHQRSEGDVDLCEDQTSESVSNHLLLKEDIPIVKVDIFEEEHEVSNEVNENLSVTEKDHVEDVIANEESKATGLSMIYCFCVIKTFSLGLSNVAFY